MKQLASFVSEMNIDLQLKNRYFPRKFTESAAKGTQTRNQRLSSVETQHFMVYIKKGEAPVEFVSTVAEDYC